MNYLRLSVLSYRRYRIPNRHRDRKQIMIENYFTLRFKLFLIQWANEWNIRACQTYQVKKKHSVCSFIYLSVPIYFLYIFDLLLKNCILYHFSVSLHCKFLLDISFLFIIYLKARIRFNWGNEWVVGFASVCLNPVCY